jgi:hypothetical protein
MQISRNVISATALQTSRAITCLAITLSSSYWFFFLSFIRVNYCIGLPSLKKANNPLCVDAAEGAVTKFRNVFGIVN